MKSHQDCYLVLFEWFQSGSESCNLAVKSTNPIPPPYIRTTPLYTTTTRTQEAVVKSLTPPPPPPLGWHTPTTKLILANTPPSYIPPHPHSLLCSVVSPPFSYEENRQALSHCKAIRYFSSFSEAFYKIDQTGINSI